MTGFWEEVDRMRTEQFGANWHCDHWITDETKPECVRTFLDRARGPAHGHVTPDGEPDDRPYPKLFATHKDMGRVRVTMASRFGHVGITRNLRQDAGYEDTCCMAELTDFSEAP